MNMAAQASSLVGTGLSVHADFCTCIAIAGTFGAKKSETVPFTLVPLRVVIPSGLVGGIAGRMERSDHTLPEASASATNVKKRRGWVPSAEFTFSANLSPLASSIRLSCDAWTFVLPDGSFPHWVRWRSSTPLQTAAASDRNEGKNE